MQEGGEVAVRGPDGSGGLGEGRSYSAGPCSKAVAVKSVQRWEREDAGCVLSSCRFLRGRWRRMF